ncbi:hypothetical protein THAOC_15075, partial [Thalassiosira oceanica]
KNNSQQSGIRSESARDQSPDERSDDPRTALGGLENPEQAPDFLPRRDCAAVGGQNCVQGAEGIYDQEERGIDHLDPARVVGNVPPGAQDRAAKHDSGDLPPPAPGFHQELGDDALGERVRNADEAHELRVVLGAEGFN